MYKVKRFARVEYLAQFLNECVAVYEFIWAYKTDDEIVVLLKEIGYV